MDNMQENLSVLAAMVVQDRLTGYSFEEIAANRGIPVEDVVTAWREYVASRTEMPQEEQRVLHELRLENLLTKVNTRLNYASAAEDYEVVLKLLDRVEALQALNRTRQSEANEQLEQLTRRQTQLILAAMMAMQTNMRALLENAFEAKTIKAIKGQVLDNYDNWFVETAQKALSGVGEV